jgi:hypothetical protein
MQVYSKGITKNTTWGIDPAEQKNWYNLVR